MNYRTLNYTSYSTSDGCFTFTYEFPDDTIINYKKSIISIMGDDDQDARDIFRDISEIIIFDQIYYRKPQMGDPCKLMTYLCSDNFIHVYRCCPNELILYIGELCNNTVLKPNNKQIVIKTISHTKGLRINPIIWGRQQKRKRYFYKEMDESTTDMKDIVSCTCVLHKDASLPTRYETLDEDFKPTIINPTYIAGIVKHKKYKEDLARMTDKAYVKFNL